MTLKTRLSPLLHSTTPPLCRKFFISVVKNSFSWVSHSQQHFKTSPSLFGNKLTFFYSPTPFHVLVPGYHDGGQIHELSALSMAQCDFMGTGHQTSGEIGSKVYLSHRRLLQTTKGTALSQFKLEKVDLTHS